MISLGRIIKALQYSPSHCMIGRTVINTIFLPELSPVSVESVESGWWKSPRLSISFTTIHVQTPDRSSLSAGPDS